MRIGGDTMRNRFIVCLLSLAIIGSLSGCGGGAGSSSAPPQDNPGVPSILELWPSNTIALTNGSITFNAKVMDQNGVPVANAAVTFTNLSEPTGFFASALKTLGLTKPKVALSASVKQTNSRGIASITVKSFTPGFVTVQAEVNSGAFPRDKKTVLFSDVFPLPTPPTPSPVLFLHVSKDGTTFDSPSDFRLTRDDSQRIIRADVFDSFGSPAPDGTIVTFGSDDPTNVTFLNPGITATTHNGQAFTVVQVAQAAFLSIPSVLNITGTATVDSLTAFNVISLFLKPVVIDGAHSYLTASPSTVNVNGTSTVTAVVYTTSGGIAPDGTSVNFTTTCGSIDPFKQTTGGVATATFIAPSTPGVCTVTGKAGGVTIGTAAITVIGPLSVLPGARPVNGLTGDTATYTISGGVPPYFVVPSDTALPPSPDNVTTSGGTFSVTVPAGTGAKTVTYTVTDSSSAGTKVAATLTVIGPASLQISPPSVTISSSSSAQTLSFTINGGTVPYTTTSSDPNKAFNDDGAGGGTAGDGIRNGTEGGIWNSTTPSSTIVVTFPALVPSGTITLNVFDSLGRTTSATITIIAGGAGGGVLTVTPSSISLTGLHNPDSNAADDIPFLITGGTGPFTVFSDNTNVIASPGPLGAGVSTFTVDPEAVSVSTSVKLTVLDTSNGTTATSSVTVTPAIMRLNPASLSVTTGTTITFTIIGGAAPFNVFPGDPGLLTVGSPPANPLVVPVGTSTFVANAVAAGTATITVVDSNSQLLTATVTISAPSGGISVSPSAMTVTGVSDASDQVVFTITGGTGPFTVQSSNTAVIPNPAVAPGPPATFTADPNAVSAATVVTLTVQDSVGGTKTVSVTVNPSVSSLGINPSSIAVTSGTEITFSIIGGLAPFNVYSSDLGIVQIVGGNPLSTLGPTFTATTTSSGSATITVVDANAKTVTATVTVNGTDFFVVPNAVTIPVDGDANFQIFGGTLIPDVNPRFDFSSNNPGAITIDYDATIDPRVFSVHGNTAATVTITVRDANLRTTTVTVTITP